MKTIDGLKGKIKDLTGKQFGKLTVVSFVDRIKSGKNLKIRWKCVCMCGNETIVRGDQLRTGNTQSCGCTAKEKLIAFNHTRKNDAQKQGLQDLIRKYKYEAKKRELKWDISDAQAIELFDQNCFYCNAKPSKRTRRGEERYLSNGIDRQDNSKGYSLENTVSCCKKCNNAKSTMSMSEFYQWLSSITTSSGVVPFYLYRTSDVSGVSGTGIIAMGAIMPSGKALLEWLGKFKTETIFDNIDQLHQIHSHEGKTQIIIGNHRFHHVLQKDNALNIYKGKENEQE